MRLVFNFTGGAARGPPLAIDECNGAVSGPLTAECFKHLPENMVANLLTIFSAASRLKITERKKEGRERESRTQTQQYKHVTHNTHTIQKSPTTNC